MGILVQIRGTACEASERSEMYLYDNKCAGGRRHWNTLNSRPCCINKVIYKQTLKPHRARRAWCSSTSNRIHWLHDTCTLPSHWRELTWTAKRLSAISPLCTTGTISWHHPSHNDNDNANVYSAAHCRRTSLPAHLRSTLIDRRQFRDGLKSHLFADAYFWSSENIRYKSVMYLLTYSYVLWSKHDFSLIRRQKTGTHSYGIKSHKNATVK